VLNIIVIIEYLYALHLSTKEAKSQMIIRIAGLKLSF